MIRPGLLLYFIAGTALLAGAASTSHAQATTPEERAIRAEVSKVRFTMAELRAWYTAQTALARYQHDHPDSELSDEDYESLAAFQRKLDSHPAFNRILASSRLSARQFALLTGAWGLASLAQTKVARGSTVDAAAREAGAPVENVTVLIDNAMEVRGLQQKLEAASEP